jgi:ABC-type Zn uptake system ZnuABC Zn-binding protein ZnuA
MTSDVYDFLCSIGELIDKLSIENIKCYHANESILAERRKSEPSAQRIADLEYKARKSGEQRVRLRDEINRRLAEAIERGRMGISHDVRTYELPGA